MKRWIGPLIVALLASVIGWYATLAATPNVLMHMALRRIAATSPMNRFTHLPATTAARQVVVRPSPDLAYSICPYDLSAGPVEVRATPVAQHYWSISIFDARTDAVFVANGSDDSGRALRVVIAQRGQVVPPGVRTVYVDGARGVVLQRVLLAEPAEFRYLDPLRRRATCAPLAAAPPIRT